MFIKLLLGFTLIPLAEMYLLIEVGSRIGTLNTICLVLLTGIAGAWLARLEGFNTMVRVRESLNQGLVPAEEMLDAMLILVAGILLFTPGFITDTFGLVLLFPPSRNAFKRWLRRRLDTWISEGKVTVIRRM
ncbi:MAG: FxsA family protein [Desulfovibrionaceae bacterium]